jgi:curli biogenesis system outer membrane secretion channel CsgG
MIKLKGAGISDRVMQVMMDPSAEPAAAASTPAAAPPPPAAAAPVVAAAPAAPVAPAAPQKKRLIIDEFEHGAVMTNVQAIFGTHMNVGKGIRAMMVKRIDQGGQATIVERAKIGAIMQEQDFSASNRVKQGTGAKIGRIKGADAMLMGDIIIFGRDDKKKGMGVMAMAGAINPVFGAASKAFKEDKAVVAIAFRLVDAETTEIIMTGEARGESVRKSKNWGAMLGSYGKGGGAVEVDMTSSNFAETIIGEATQDCINKLAEEINKKIPTLAARVVIIETRVADVSGSTLVIAAGANDGVAVGDRMEVSRVIREVRDPATKEVLDVVAERVGDLVITNVRDKVSTGAYTGQPVKVNDLVRKK